IIGTEMRRNGGSFGYLADSKIVRPENATSKAWRLRGTSCCLTFGDRIVIVPEGLKIWKNLSIRASSGNWESNSSSSIKGRNPRSSNERTATDAVSSND